jgi:hypothetical protein
MPDYRCLVAVVRRRTAVSLLSVARQWLESKRKPGTFEVALRREHEMSESVPIKRWFLVALAVLTMALTGPRLAGAQEVAGFDGYIQSGTC